MNQTITPVFVIGLNRNGTTWLGNILSQCFDISSPYHELHYGVCEVNLYDNAKYWGDFSQLNNYINFLESYCNADVFKLLEGKLSWFQEHPAENFYQFFFETIDQFTQKQGNQYWVVKLDPGFFHDAAEFDRFKKEVQKRYSTARYIVIQRAFEGYIDSYINMIGEAKISRNTSLKRKISGITGAMFYHYFYPRMHKMPDKGDTLALSYENLKNDFTDSLENIRQFIGYTKKPKPDALKRNVQNTSFTTGEREKKGALIALSAFVFKYFSPLTALAVRIRYKFQKPNKLPPLWWRLTKAEHFKEQLKQELKDTDQLRLLELLK